MNKKNIVFIRHAESQANAGSSTENAHSISLSSKGILQAEKLAEIFPFEPQLIIVSEFLRTQETAAPLISKLPDVKVETWNMIHEFTYLDREKHKNTTAAERKKYVHEYWERNDPFYKDGPQEESFFDLLKRGESFFEKLKEQKENKIAIFSHGQFLISLKVIKKMNTRTNTLNALELTKLMTTFKKLIETTPLKNTGVITLKELSD
jgi:broad specificity phosphatase PhoE